MTEKTIENRLKTRYVCPYCLAEFAAGDIHFVDLNGGKDAFTVIGMESEAPSAGEYSFSSRKGNRRTVAAKVVEDTSTDFRFGVFTNDTIADENLSFYGLKPNGFGFSRGGVFYRIGNEKAEDTGIVLESDVWDDDAPMTLHIDKNGRDKSLTKRLCPKCHTNLPNYFFCCPPERKHRIALAGCTSSGKTQYIVMALKALKQQLPMLGLGHVTLELEDWFINAYCEKLKTEKMTSATGTNYSLMPFVVRVSPSNQPNEPHFLMFYDVAGEYYDKSDYAVDSHFSDAQAIFLAMDASAYYPDYTKQEWQATRCPTPDISESLRLINEYNLGAKCSNVYGILTKLDTVICVAEGKQPVIHGNRGAVKDGFRLIDGNMKMHQGCVDRTTIAAIDSEIKGRIGRESLGLNLEKQITDMMNESIKCTFLGVSTYQIQINSVTGEAESKLDMNFAVAGHRLIEPLLALMADMNILPSESKVISTEFDEEELNEREQESRRGLFGLFRRKKASR